MIPQSFIQDLLNRVDIVDVVGRYVQLKKGGANLMGLCPFHNEKSPSFTVSPTKQFYHCFGCGAHGSAIGFLMEYSGLSYVDAIRELAQSSGMVVPQEDDRIAPEERAAQRAQSLALTEVLHRAGEYYRQQLRSSTRAIDYLKGRGLTGEIAARFGLGYAPDGWQNLESVIGNYQDEAIVRPLIDSGMVVEREAETEHPEANRKRYDRFRDRIMFPIRNTKGQVIGFGGRILDVGEPKYLNSPETPLFSKGQELYGLFEARQAIRDHGFVLVTEGYMDVVALAQLGFANAVATLGTACTATHVQKLLRQADTVVFSFDGDSAGRRAARRALEATLPLVADNKMIKFLFLPAEHDPDSYIRENGAAAFAEEIARAMPLSRFLLKLVTEDKDLRQPEDRARAQFDAKPLLQTMPNGGLRLQILRGLAELTSASVAELEGVCGLPKSSGEKPPSRFAPQGRMKRAAPTDNAHRLLRLLMNYPHFAAQIDTEQRYWLLETEQPHAELLGHLLEQCAQVQGDNHFAAFLEQLEHSELAQDYAALRLAVLRDDISEADAALEFKGAVWNLVQEAMVLQSKTLAAKVEAGEAEPQALLALNQKIQQAKTLWASSLAT